MWKRLIDFLNQFRRPPPAPAPSPPPKLDTTLVKAINAERTGRGFPPLTEDGRLDVIAQDWAGVMAANRTLDHGDFESRITHIYPTTPDAENIASGQATVAQVVAAWMRSAPHRANILGEFNRVGVGFARSEDGMTYWCVDFDSKLDG